MMSSDKQLYKKLIEHDEDEDDVEATTTTSKVSYVRLAAAPGSARPSTTKRGSGLCKCILITLAVLMILGMILCLAAYMSMSNIVRHMTVTTPHEPFAVVDMPEAELRVVKDRVLLFVDELEATGTATNDLVITQKEVNAFIGKSDYLRGNMYVTLEPGTIVEEHSLPTWMLPGGKGRYFVGHESIALNTESQIIEVDMETAPGVHDDWFVGPLFFAKLHYLVTHDASNKQDPFFELYLEQGSFFGQSAPQEYIDQHENLLEDLYDPDCEDAQKVLKVLSSIERVSIEADQVVVVPKRN